MTLPASGEIKMSQVKAEYNLTDPVALTDAYGEFGVPSSGEIRMSDLHGKTAFRLTITPPSISGGCSSATVESCGATTSTLTLNPSGGVAPYTYTWVHVSGTPANVTEVTSNTFRFTRYEEGTALGRVYTGVYNAKVTDSRGAIAYRNITVSTTHRFTGIHN